MRNLAEPLLCEETIYVLFSELLFLIGIETVRYFFTYGYKEGDIMLRKISFIFAVFITGFIFSVIVALAFGITMSYA